MKAIGDFFSFERIMIENANTKKIIFSGNFDKQLNTGSVRNIQGAPDLLSCFINYFIIDMELKKRDVKTEWKLYNERDSEKLLFV